MCEHASVAVRSCPFLARLAKEHGEEYAQSIAIAPSRAVGSGPLPAGIDAVVELASSFRVVHGPKGVLPLNKGPPSKQAAVGRPSACPFHARAQGATPAVEGPAPAAAAATRAAPFATISLSKFGKGGSFDGFLRRHLNNNSKGNNKGKLPRQHQQHHQGPSSSNAGKAPHGPSSTGPGGMGSSSSGSGSSSSSGPLGGSSNLKPQRPLGDPSISSTSSSGGNASHALGRGTGSSGHGKPPAASSSSAYSSSSSSSSAPTVGPGGSSSMPSSSWPSSSGSVRGPSPFQQRLQGSNSSSSSHSGSGADMKGGQQHRHTGSSSNAATGSAPGCPLRKWLGPVAGLVFNQYDKIVCPPPIVAARAALAKTAPVQQLRPQALPVKLVAVAAVVAGVNLPCGAVREHFEKFSLGWFIAVHATIPFVAMLRKAVIMPKYAILATIASAVLGQMVGARLERMRLSYEQQHGPLLALPLALPLPLQQHTEDDQAAERQQPLPGKRGASSSSAAGRQHSMPQHGGSSGRNWREQLLADPEPPAGVGVPASSCRAGLREGLFAHLQSVKA